MAYYALITSEINNDFYDQEKAFYIAQLAEWKSGMLELFHGSQSNNPSSCVVLMAIESEKEIDKTKQQATKKPSQATLLGLLQ